MWRIILALWLALAPAWADGISVPGVPRIGGDAAFSYPPSAGGGPYVGPGDLVSGAFAWWGLRCYSNAYSGNVADIADAATGNTTGTRLQCSGGVVSALSSGSACGTTTGGATFITGGACSSLATTCASACRVVTLYDQSGSTNCTTACDATQPTNASRPTLTTSCQNSHPCAVFGGSQTLVTSSVVGTTNQPFSMSGVAIRTGATTSFGDVLGMDFGGLQFVFNNSANQFGLYAGTAVVPATAADSSWHAIQGVYNGASSVLYIDGSSTALATPGTNGVGGAINLGNNNNALTGDIAEAGIWAVGFTGTQQSNLNGNQRTYWGF